MKYLKPSRLRNAFFRVVSFDRTVPFTSVAPMAAVTAFWAHKLEIAGKEIPLQDEDEKYIAVNHSIAIAQQRRRNTVERLGRRKKRKRNEQSFSSLRTPPSISSIT